MKQSIFLFLRILLILALTTVSGLFAIVEPWYLELSSGKGMPLFGDDGSFNCPASVEPNHVENICLRLKGPIEIEDYLAPSFSTISDDPNFIYDHHSFNERGFIHEVTPQTDDYLTCWEVDQSAFLDQGAVQGDVAIVNIYIHLPKSQVGLYAECSIYIDRPLLGFITKPFLNVVAWLLIITNILACLALFTLSGLRSGKPFGKWALKFMLYNILTGIVFCALSGFLFLYFGIQAFFYPDPVKTWGLAWLALILTTLLACAQAIPAVLKFKKERKQPRGESETIDAQPGDS